MKYVLFVCNHNAGRSQMAQALFERHAPDDVRAESAGSTPAKQLWPNVVEAMRELDIDIAGRRPKKLTVEMQLHYRRPVPIGEPITVRAELRRENGPDLYVDGAILSETGEVLTTAAARWRRLDKARR